MSSYAKNMARPATASVAQVEDPSGTDTHDPFGGNAGSLESGSGGSVDLSAIDQDVTLLNNHAVDFHGPADDAAAAATMAWSDDRYALVVTSTTENGETDFAVADPANPENYVIVTVTSSGLCRVAFRSGGVGAQISLDGANRLSTTDISHAAGTGPIVVAPDGGVWRLGVANDGTPTSTLVTPAP